VDRAGEKEVKPCCFSGRIEDGWILPNTSVFRFFALPFEHECHGVREEIVVEQVLIKERERSKQGKVEEKCLRTL
jgi:hypothetical protein